MVRIPEQSGQYLLSLAVVGRWGRNWGRGRDWGGGLWFVTLGSMGRGGQLQGFCPISIRGGDGMEWEGHGECGKHAEGVENSSLVFLTLTDLEAWLNTGAAHVGKLDQGPSPSLLPGEGDTREMELPLSGICAAPWPALALSGGVWMDFLM